MDTNQRLRRLLDERGWTEYKLSKVCGLSQSTLANIFKRNTVPSITTLEVICKGFGITLSQFFADGEMVEMTPELKEVFESWMVLTPLPEIRRLTDAQSHEPERINRKPSGFLFFCLQCRYYEWPLSFSLTPRQDFPV